MSAIASFSNQDFQTLTVWKDDSGREFYRAIDACANLRHSNPGQALSRHVDPEYIVQIDDGTNRAGLTNYLSEPGLYQLIFSSKTEWAKKFQRWVFEEVLPKLRADRFYVAPNANRQDLEKAQQTIYTLERELNTQAIALAATQKELLESQLVNNESVIDGLWIRCQLNKRSGEPNDNPCYKDIFAALDLYFGEKMKPFMGTAFHKERINHILDKWEKSEIPLSSRMRSHRVKQPFQGDFRSFIKCIVDNYYVPGVGGGGQQIGLTNWWNENCE